MPKKGKFLIPFLCTLLFGILNGQWVPDSTVNTPVIQVIGDQKGAQVVPDGEKGMIVFWYDKRNGSNWDLYAQRLDSMGYLLWDSLGVPISTASGHQYGHRAIPDGSGGALVVWQDSRSGNWDIYIQRLSANGLTLWDSLGVPVCTPPGDQEYPEIVGDGTGGAFVAWEDKRSGSTPDIYAQRISSQGQPMWQENGVPVVTAPNHQRRPKLAPAPSFGVYVVWYDHRSSLYQADIYIQRLDDLGEALWQENGIGIRTLPTHDVMPQVIPDGKGGAIVSFENEDIYIQRRDSTGNSLWTPQGVLLCSDTGNQWGNRLVSDGDGGAIVAWVDNRLGLLNMDIYAQRVDSTGLPQWIPNGVQLASAPSNQLNLEMAPDDSGGALVIWQDNRNGVAEAEIYAQRVDHLGVIHWGAGGVAVSLAPLPQLFPSLTSDGNGNLLAAWEDRREDTHWDVYAQRVRRDGTLGGPYVLGDVNGDGLVDVSDLIYLGNYLFMGGPPPVPLLSGDVNGDCDVTSLDLIYLSQYLFLAGPSPIPCPSVGVKVQR